MCINSIFCLPILMPFYQNHLGLSFHDFLIGESVFAASMILLDVPTGWLADQWGRKKCLILGALVFGLGILSMYYAIGFWTIIAAQGVVGIGHSLMTGANSALLYDSLLATNREHEFRKREGFRFALQLYACAGAAIIGGYLYSIDASLPFHVEAGICALAAALAFGFVEPPRHKKTVEGHPAMDILRTIKYVMHGHKEIAGLIMLMTLTFATTKICMWSIQAYTLALGWNPSWNGWIISIVMVAGGVFGHIGHKIWPSLYGRKALYILLAALTVALILAGLKITWFGLICLGFEAFVFGFGMPRAQEAVNNLATSGERATILSTASLATSLGFIPMSQIIGWASDKYGIGDGLLIHAAVIAVCGIGAYQLIERSIKSQAARSISTATGT
ncbi:MAG: MFS transporter [Alphaproteobacteria bacterium]|nr:MFS transporter [Alphaproteobacteria bacterium]